jgi:hypothetical protein
MMMESVFAIAAGSVGNDSRICSLSTVGPLARSICGFERDQMIF